MTHQIFRNDHVPTADISQKFFHRSTLRSILCAFVLFQENLGKRQICSPNGFSTQFNMREVFDLKLRYAITDLNSLKIGVKVRNPASLYKATNCLCFDNIQMRKLAMFLAYLVKLCFQI